MTSAVKMTSAFRISLLKHNLSATSLRETDAPNAVIVSVRQVTGPRGKRPKTLFDQSVRVPAGFQTGRSVKVPPGSYVLEARMPSGVVLRKEETAQSGKTKLIEFEGDHSSQEWLSWHAMTGAVPTQLHVKDQDEKALGPARAYSVGRSDARQARLDLAVLRGRSGESLWDLPEFWNDPVHPMRLLPGGPMRPNEVSQTRRFALWRLDDALPPPATDLEGAGLRRIFALFQKDATLTWTTVPAPWRTSANRLAPMEVVYDLRRPREKSPISLGVLDSDCAALLSYLGAGRMPEASASLRDMGPNIIQMIAEKQRNPYAAAAAGYVALMSPPARKENWRQWLENLMNWFPVLPDGAILHARSLMDGKRTRGRDAQIRAVLHEAVRRGPPVFTVGLRHLLSGLLQFDGETGKGSAYERVSKLAAHADPGETFLTVTRSIPR